MYLIRLLDRIEPPISWKPQLRFGKKFQLLRHPHLTVAETPPYWLTIPPSVVRPEVHSL